MSRVLAQRRRRRRTTTTTKVMTITTMTTTVMMVMVVVAITIMQIYDCRKSIASRLNRVSLKTPT